MNSDRASTHGGSAADGGAVAARSRSATAQRSASVAGAPFSELTTRRLGPVRRYFVRHPVAMDLVVMAIFAGSVLLGLVTAAPAEPVTQRDLLIGGTVCLLGTVALFWRRRVPVAIAAAVVVLLVASLAFTGSTNSLELALGFAVYAIAASRPPWMAWTALASVVTIASLAAWRWAAEVTTVTQDGQELEIDERATIVVGITLLSLAALAIGTSVRNRRLHVADLVERANALARDRDQQAQIARAAERSRIAREMHDVVAHSLSVMIALADGAGAALANSPDKARLALTELSDTGRTALTDMRRVLGVLDTDAPLEPPGSQDLGDLVERFRTAGLPVRIEGLTTELPPDTGLALAVYRIIQEALTNALRYARGTSSVDVTVSRDKGAVRVTVVDHGTDLALDDSGGAGRGLIGMAERAAVFGGTVDAGPWNDGWRVRAELPWRAES